MDKKNKNSIEYLQEKQSNDAEEIKELKKWKRTKEDEDLKNSTKRIMCMSQVTTFFGLCTAVGTWIGYHYEAVYAAMKVLFTYKGEP